MRTLKKSSRVLLSGAVVRGEKKKFTRFRPNVFSRHPSHQALREELPLMPFRSVVRLGSVTEKRDTVTNGGARIEINTIRSIQNSANKLKMKHCFEKAGVKTAEWWTSRNGTDFVAGDNPNQEEAIAHTIDLPYPIVAKNIFGSRGTGNFLLKTQEELEAWLPGKTLNRYIFEKFYNFNREYRLHVTEDGCFYTCRKMLKENTPEDKKWFRNDANCVWIVEENAAFDKPVNWDTIEEECVSALKEVGLDVGAFDVRIQSTNDNRGRKRENPEFILIEVNSAPSLAVVGTDKYLKMLPTLLKAKHVRL